MGQDNIVPRRIDGVEGVAGQVMVCEGPGVVESWSNPFSDLSRGHLIVIPTTGVNGTTGWTKVENNVTVDNQDTRYIKLTVVNAAGAEDGHAYIGTYGLCPGGNAAKINWDKELFIQFIIRRINEEVTSPPLCYVQFKIANTAGALAADGLGIRIADNAADPHTNDRKLYGESYGSGGSDEVIDLGTVMTPTRQYTIGIHHKPGEFVKWYINGTLAGTQSNTNHVPTGDSGAPGFIVVSADKAATDPDASAELYAGQFIIWQAH